MIAATSGWWPMGAAVRGQLSQQAGTDPGCWAPDSRECGLGVENVQPADPEDGFSISAERKTDPELLKMAFDCRAAKDPLDEPKWPPSTLTSEAVTPPGPTRPPLRTARGRPPSAVHAPVDEVEEDVGSREDHAGVGVDGVGVLDDPETTQALLLGAGRLRVQRESNYHPLLLVRHVLGRHGRPGVARQAVGVGLAVRAVQHHGPGVGHAAGAWQRLGLEERGE